MIIEANNDNTNLAANPVISDGRKRKSDKYTCGKKYKIMLFNSDEIQSRCNEYSNLVLTVIKDVLECNVSVESLDYFSVTFAEDTDVEDFTDSLKKALRGKFKGGRLTKTTIRALCVSFPNKVYFLIDIMNGWEV